MPTTWEPKDFIAIYAAISTTGQLFYNIWRHRKEDRDKARKEPSLSFKIERQRIPHTPWDRNLTDADYYYALIIFNVGNSDIVIKELVINTEIWQNDKIPASLSPATSIEISLNGVKEYQKSIVVEAIDGTGKKWKTEIPLT